MFWDKEVPRLVSQDRSGRRTEVTIVAGTVSDLKAPSPPPNSWASQKASDVAIWSIRLDAGAQWTMPRAQNGTNRALYVVKGSGLKMGDRTIPTRHQVLLNSETDAPLSAGDEALELLVLQGRPIGEPVVKHGPFVMNTREEIVQAFQDYRRTQFGGWPWPDSAPVHGKDNQRFARHADGRTEGPA
jgi:hypothetical protein